MRIRNKVVPVAIRTGEHSLRFKFGAAIEQSTFQHVQQFNAFVLKEFHWFIEETIPSYHTLTVMLRKKVECVEQLVQMMVEKWRVAPYVEMEQEVQHYYIPVCYEEPFSLDMKRIQQITNLSFEEIIQLHTAKSYSVFTIGFLPGFPYLGELPKQLYVPRLQKPRLQVEKGTVGIGGSQTGIYSLSSPGGWNIIGRTPVDLYCPESPEPFLVKAGDYLTFYPISMRRFEQFEKEKRKKQSDLPQLLIDFYKQITT